MLQSTVPEMLDNKEPQAGGHRFPWEGEIERNLLGGLWASGDESWGVEGGEE